MIKILSGFLIALCFLPKFTQAQAPPTDSILTMANQATDDSLIIFYTKQAILQTIYADIDTAVHFIRLGRAAATRLEDHATRANFERFLGIAYILRNANALALDQYLKADAIFDSIGDQEGRGRVLVNIATVYISEQNYHLALERLEEAKEISMELRDTLNLSNILHNQGICYDNLDQAELALEKFQLALELKEKSGILREVPMTLNSIAEVYHRMGEYQASLPYIRRSLQYREEFSDQIGMAAVMVNLADYFLNTDQLDSAKYYQEQASQMFRDLKVPSFLITAQMLEAKILQAQDRAAEAFVVLEDAIRLKDSITNEENRVLTADLESAYRARKKEEEIKDLSMENTMQGLQIFQLEIALGGLVLALILVVFLLMQNMRSRKALFAKNLELESLHREQEGMVHLVIHDLKAPMHKAMMLMEMVAEPENLNPVQAHALEKGQEVCQQSLNLIQDLTLLHVSESGSGPEMSELELIPFLESILEGFKAYAGSKSIQLHLDLKEEQILLQTNPGDLRRILDNLISNAIKFSPQGKSVWLVVEPHAYGWEIKVKDEGPGISKEDQKKAFEKFQRLSARPTGGESSTGLGLAIVKSLVERLRGRVQIQSELGQGTEFVLFFPKTGSV